MAFEANVCRVWRPVIPSQCTSDSSEEDDWAAEVSSVIYVEFRGDRTLGSKIMALFLRSIRLVANLT